jgi:hypothetical protein
VTQNGSPVQLDVYFKVMGGLTTRIQCTIDTFENCTAINANGSLGSAVGGSFNFNGYRKIPGVLHAYKASAADLVNLVRPLAAD